MPNKLNVVLRYITIALVAVRLGVVPLQMRDFWGEFPILLIRWIVVSVMVALFLLIPGMITLAYHKRWKHRSIGGFNIAMMIVFPILVGMTPGVIRGYWALPLGWIDALDLRYYPQGGLQILPAVVILTILLNISLQSEKRLVAERCMWISMIGGVLLNSLVPWVFW
jgi:hypothetical protein